MIYDGRTDRGANPHVTALKSDSRSPIIGMGAPKLTTINLGGHLAQLGFQHNKSTPLIKLPAEIKLLIMCIIPDLLDLISFTTASRCFQYLAVKHNIFTTSALEMLKSRNISLLPKSITVPHNYKMACVHVWCPSAKYSIPQLHKALSTFLRQYSESPIRPLRLSVSQCLSLLNIERVLIWKFSYARDFGEVTCDGETNSEIYEKTYHQPSYSGMQWDLDVFDPDYSNYEELDNEPLEVVDYSMTDPCIRPKIFQVVAEPSTKDVIRNVYYIPRGAEPHKDNNEDDQPCRVNIEQGTDYPEGNYRVDVGNMVNRRANDAFTTAAENEFSQILFSQLILYGERSCLQNLPTKVKMLILNSISNMEDLISCTKALPSWYHLAYNHGVFANLLLKQLHTWRIHLLPNGIRFPQTFTKIAISLLCYRGKAAQIETALNSFFRQYVHSDRIRLSPSQCLALQEIIAVYAWDFMYDEDLSFTIDDIAVEEIEANFVTALRDDSRCMGGKWLVGVTSKNWKGPRRDSEYLCNVSFQIDIPAPALIDFL